MNRNARYFTNKMVLSPLESCPRGRIKDADDNYSSRNYLEASLLCKHTQATYSAHLRKKPMQTTTGPLGTDSDGRSCDTS
jgi:hypothetical protein